MSLVQNSLQSPRLQDEELALKELDIRLKKERYLDLLKQKKQERGRRDLWFFNKYVLGYTDLTDKTGFHGELCSYVEDIDKRFVLALMPRGSLKTTCGPIGYALQMMVVDPNIRILLASEEFSLASKILSEIKGHIETNDIFKELYGDISGKVKWNEKEITINTRWVHKKEPTITCAGIDVTKVGNHYDLIFVDDPHSDKNVTTREQIEKVKNWYKQLLSLLDPPRSRPKYLAPPRIVITATRWHYADLSSWIIDLERIREQENKPKRYHILHKRAVMTGKLDEKTKQSQLLWPERLDKDFLIDQLADQGPYVFNCQYQNNPVDDDSAIFKKSWIEFYDPAIDTGEDEFFFSTLDPIRDEDSNDYAAIVTCSMSRDWKAKIREVRRGKWSDHETLDQLIQVWRKWHPKKIGVETVAWQKVYYRFLKQEQIRRGIRIPIMELNTDTRVTKKMRIRSMVPYWKSNFFLVPGKAVSLLKGNMAILVDELLNYPRTANDDCVDALAYMDQLLQRPQIHQMLKRAPRNSFQGIKENSPKSKSKYLGNLNTAVA